MIMSKPKLAGAAIAAVLFVIILLQNSEMVVIDVLFWPIILSKLVLIPLLMALGFVVGFLVAKLTGNRGTATAVPPPPPDRPDVQWSDRGH
jgi:hypothetical protein